MKKRLGIGLTAGLLSALALVAPPTAQADDFAQCVGGGMPCGPDDRTHYFCYGSSVQGPDRADMRGSIQFAMDTMDSQTVMADALHTCISSTDVRWLDGGTLSQDVLGQATCQIVDGSNPRICQAGTARINISSHYWYGNNTVGGSDGVIEAGEIALNRDLTACHELGHTLGFTHHDLDWYQTHDNDCMRNPWLEAEGANNGWRNYNQHHIDHINGFV